MFHSLRAKLVFAFGLVTFLTVLLAALGTLWQLREREVEAARERQGQVRNIVAEQVMWRAYNNWQVDALAAFLQQRAEELGVRFLLTDAKGVILADTDGSLDGALVQEVLNTQTQPRQDKNSDFSFTTWQGHLVFDRRTGPEVRFTTQNYHVKMIVPQAEVADAWKDLIPPLLTSGLIALAAATVVAYAISRSITRPVALVTRGSEEMARGYYHQRIPVESRDEIGRMAGAFNQMAEQVARTHQAMRDLNGNVAHELKTPLASIKGYAQALLDGVAASPDGVEHAARVINDEADRMHRLVEDLLYLSRLESGQLQLDRAPIQIPAFLEHAAERVAWRAKESGKSVRLQLGIDIPVIQGDERRLEQVLANLLDNALRHTPAGGIITLGARWSFDHVTLTVHNTGSYIPPEHIDRIFERFYQVNASRTRDGHHGGLGLAIAREIVVAHGGTLTATSDPERGTEFAVVLPIQRPAHPGEFARSAARPAPSVPAPATPRGESVA